MFFPLLYLLFFAKSSLHNAKHTAVNLNLRCDISETWRASGGS